MTDLKVVFPERGRVNEEPKKGYKITNIFRRGNKNVEAPSNIPNPHSIEYRSFNYNSKTDATSVKYVRNKWTERPDHQGPLAVFDNEKDAMSTFKEYSIRGRRHYALFECKYTPSEENHLYAGLKFMPYTDIIKYFPGTDFADKVKITKRLDIK